MPAGAALGRRDDVAAVAGAQIDHVVGRRQLRHVEHLLDERRRRRHPDDVLAGLADGGSKGLAVEAVAVVVTAGVDVWAAGVAVVTGTGRATLAQEDRRTALRRIWKVFALISSHSGPGASGEPRPPEHLHLEHWRCLY